MPKFYQMTNHERIAFLGQQNIISAATADRLKENSINQELVAVQHLSENPIGAFTLPLGIAYPVTINAKTYAIPLVTEETSIVAALCKAAKTLMPGSELAQATLITSLSGSLVIGHIYLYDIVSTTELSSNFANYKNQLIAQGNRYLASLVARGGGIRNINLKPLTAMTASIEIELDSSEAMGANYVTQVAEYLSTIIEQQFNLQIGAAIVSNFATRSLVHANYEIAMPYQQAEKILHLNNWAIHDPYRATTHNKGIFNAIDAILLATGNDWRAVNASGHAYAASNHAGSRGGTNDIIPGSGTTLSQTMQQEVSDRVAGGGGDYSEQENNAYARVNYQPLSSWTYVDNKLCGKLTLPMNIGTVGGAISTNPMAQVALEILGYPDKNELAQVIVAAGILQNYAALNALANDGIVAGHMRLQINNLVAACGELDAKTEQDLKMRLTQRLATTKRLTLTDAQHELAVIKHEPL